jgi:hypothetical protein
MFDRNTDAARKYIAEKFGVVYRLNDPAHREDHFSSVEKCGLYINDKLDLEVDPYLIMLVSWFHDLFAWRREVHHTLAQRWVKYSTDAVFRCISDVEKEMVAHACGQHRASYTGEYHTLLAELMSAADRGKPDNLESRINRSVQYNLAKGISLKEAQVNARAHMKDKLGAGGYARYNEVYLLAFEDELKIQQEQIALL